MAVTDYVLDLAESVSDAISLFDSDFVVGLLVGAGMVFWIAAGQRGTARP